MLNWIEVTVTTTAEAKEAVSHLLMEEGAGGVVESTPAISVAYFPDDSQWKARLDRIRRSVAGLSRFGLDVGPARVASRGVAEESWAEAWKEYFYPTRLGERVVVRPTWRDFTPEEGDLVIHLDPGMAFGTGSHPTTRLCVQALEERVRPGHSLIDIGTGSGILAIAAGLLGAASVVACDTDPVAVKVARENADKNGVGRSVKVFAGSWPQVIEQHARADIVVANIVADVICEMAPDVGRLVAPGGCFIASGIVETRGDDVKARLHETGWRVASAREEGEWLALVATRADRPGI